MGGECRVQWPCYNWSRAMQCLAQGQSRASVPAYLNNWQVAAAGAQGQIRAKVKLKT